MSARSNESIYSNEELPFWLELGNAPLIAEEEYILSKWLPESKNNPILEGGTGSGRIAFNIEKSGYTNIAAFDLLPELLNGANALANNKGSDITFFQSDVRDFSIAETLKHKEFACIIYLQQVLSFVPIANWPCVFANINQALQPGGIWIGSFLYYEGRAINPLLRTTMRTVRFFRRQNTSSYSLPWLKLGGKINYSVLGRDQALVHWLPRSEIEQSIAQAGLEIVESTTSKQITYPSSPETEMLYVACRKKNYKAA